MKRISITGSQWFDLDRAETFAEDERYDGSNYISLATGSQWEHECLYRTSSGRWVLYAWSQWDGVLDEYRLIEDADAVAWLIQQGHDVPNDLQQYADTTEM